MHLLIKKDWSGDTGSWRRRPLRSFCRKEKVEIIVMFTPERCHMRSVQLPVALHTAYFQAERSLPTCLYPALSTSCSEVERVPGAGPADWTVNYLSCCPTEPTTRMCVPLSLALLVRLLQAVCLLRVKNWLVSHATSRSHLLRHPYSRCPSNALQAIRLALSP